MTKVLTKGALKYKFKNIKTDLAMVTINNGTTLSHGQSSGLKVYQPNMSLA